MMVKRGKEVCAILEARKVTQQNRGQRPEVQVRTAVRGPTTTPGTKAKALKDPRATPLEAGPRQRLEARAYTRNLSSSALRSLPSGYQPGEHPSPTQQTTAELSREDCKPRHGGKAAHCKEKD